MLEDDDDGDLFGLEREASDAEQRGPRVEIPSVRDPSESLPDPSTVDPKIQRSFAIAVLYANVALLGVALGLMLIGFRGEWRWGGLSVVVGVLAGIRVYQTYRGFEQWREERDASEDEGDGETEDEAVEGESASHDTADDDGAENDVHAGSDEEATPPTERD